jgi:hypothetical protein
MYREDVHGTALLGRQAIAEKSEAGYQNEDLTMEK